MNEHPSSGKDEARAILAQAEESRRNVLAASHRPVWLDFALAVVTGVVFALAQSGLWLLGVLVLAVGIVAVLLAERRVVKRRGRVFDLRALGARSGRFALVYLLIFLLALFEPPAAWQPWFAIGLGLVVTAAGFAWLRWDARYQDRRLAAGDYHPYDLL